MTASVAELLARNPYPGLRPFGQSESDLFFGRDQQITGLAAQLVESLLVAVVGTSGCGKSSLVLAGLLNHLARHRAEGGATEWRPVVVRPGNRPIANLAEELAKTLHPAQKEDGERAGPLYGMLRLGGLGLVEAVRVARLDSHVRILVVVDQFEEIFRFKRLTDPEEAAAFVKLLLNAARDPASPVSVILTMRSNALGDCAEFRDLPEAINQGLYLVPRLTREQRKEAITGPAQLRGYEIAKSLVQRVINDVSDDFNELPVMQHVLTRTWQSWAQNCAGTRTLDLEDYQRVGEAKLALSRHADEAFASLQQSGLEAVTEKVFRALTERAGDGVENRRALEFERLCQVVGGTGDSGREVPPEARARIAEVVERFRSPDTPFLMPPAAQKRLEDNPVIDITHESVIRLWKRLRDWAQIESEARAGLMSLLEKARLSESESGDLLHKRDLGRALEWQRKVEPTAAWIGLYTSSDGVAEWLSVQAFIMRSAEESGRQHRRWKAIIWLLRGLVAAIVVVSVGAVFVSQQLQSKTLSSQYANQALLELDQDPARSARWALAALEMDQENERAVVALRQSLAALEVAHVERIEELPAPVSDIRLSPDGSVLVVAAGTQVALFDTTTWQRRTVPFDLGQGVDQAWLLNQNQILLTLSREGRLEVRRMNGNPEILPIVACERSDDPIFKLAASMDGQRIAIACREGELTEWDLAAPEPRLEASLIGRTGNTITALAFSGDGDYLASGSVLGEVSIWKRGQKAPWISRAEKAKQLSPLGHSKAVRDISFHPQDASWLVTASDDSTAVVWKLDLERRRLASRTGGSADQSPLAHPRPVSFVSFADLPLETTPGNHPRIASVADKNVKFWSDGQEMSRRSGHEDWIRDLSHSTGGLGLTLTASDDGMARVWASDYAAPLALLPGHRGGVVRARFITGQGDQVVTASDDGTLRVWHLKLPSAVALMASGWILSAAVDPSGTQVAVAAENGSAALFGLVPPTGAIRVLEKPSESDMISMLSWERGGKFLAGRQSSYDIYSRSKPVFWAIEDLKLIRPTWLEGPGKEVLSATFSTGRDELVTVRADGEVAVWDTAALLDPQPQPVVIVGTEPGTQAAAISADGHWVATVRWPYSDEVRLWNRLVPGAPPRLLAGHTSNVISVRFSPDSKHLVSSSSDRSAIIWSVDEDRRLELTGGHSAGLLLANFSPDGRQVATASADKTVRVWNAETGRELAALSWHGEAVNDVRFAPDGRILTASDDGVVRLGSCESCSLDTDKLLQRAENYAVLRESELKEIRDKVAGSAWSRLLRRWWPSR